MYIAYVYIEEFEGLKDVELCLSNRWVIRKESLENGKLTLSIKENPEFIEGFWDENPKSTTKLNVSAIVGRNGSGKTRILKLLAMISTRSSMLSGAKIFSIFNSNDGLNLVGVSGHEMVVDWFCPSLGTCDYLDVAEIEDKFILVVFHKVCQNFPCWESEKLGRARACALLRLPTRTPAGRATS